jgi:tetratricopeptide (TPR) repeat protein
MWEVANVMPAGSTDRWGVPLQGGNPQAVGHFNAAVEELVALSGDPLSAVEDAVGEDDGLVLGHILRAYLLLYGTTSTSVTKAAQIVSDIVARDLDLDEREVLHLRAVQAWASGEWTDAVRSLERALLHEPRDLLALKVAQDLYFFLGQSEHLREVVARVHTAWRPVDQGWGYVQGMYAFGFEENAAYREAEAFARLALDRHPQDVWATHALAHVFEMEGRTDDGVAFLSESAKDWQSSYFAIHNWWHQSLYLLERGEIEEVLALYDGPIRQGRSSEWLDIVDAAALLWRLSIFGVDVGERIEDLSADIEPLLGEPIYIFNDWHAVMAISLAGRSDLVEQVIADSRRHAVGTNRAVAERAGLALLEGFSSFAAGQFERATEVLSAVRPEARAVGGSHAQRDVIELTLIAAAARSGQTDFAETLAGERVRRKPTALSATKRLLMANAR